MSPEQLLGSVDFTDQTVVADMEAGIGTLTRVTEGVLDAALIVVEATPKSMEVGVRALGLARERNIKHVYIVANRVRDGDLDRLREQFPGDELVAVPDDQAITAAEREGVAPLDTAPDAPAVQALVALAHRLRSG